MGRKWMLRELNTSWQQKKGTQYHVECFFSSNFVCITNMKLYINSIKNAYGIVKSKLLLRVGDHGRRLHRKKSHSLKVVISQSNPLHHQTIFVVVFLLISWSHPNGFALRIRMLEESEIERERERERGGGPNNATEVLLFLTAATSCSTVQILVHKAYT